MSAWATPLTGHCFCKASTYTLDPNVAVSVDLLDFYEGLLGLRRPYTSFYDHCTDCRRATSSLATAWLMIPTIFLTFSASSPIKTYTSASGVVERKFCGECGTTFTYWARGREKLKGLGLVDLTVASLCEEDLQRLDGIEGLVPRFHMWWNSGVGWVKEDILKGGGGVVAYRSGKCEEGERVGFEGLG